MHGQNVGQFYDRTQRWYTWAYSDRTSLGIHYGFWEPGTRSRSEALINQYRVVRDQLELRPGQTILDAGCGVGGASLWLAAHTPARYTGITLSGVQCRQARRHSQRRGLADRAQFEQMDYHQTTFPSASFDHVFAIESFCYTYPTPIRMLREMFRLLKPGGRLVISDGVLRRQPRTDQEQRLAEDFAVGYAMNGWCTVAEVATALTQTGFRLVHSIDKTAAIEPSVGDIHARQRRWSVLVRIMATYGLASQEALGAIRATASQREFYTSGLFGYYVFVARKPTTQ